MRLGTKQREILTRLKNGEKCSYLAYMEKYRFAGDKEGIRRDSIDILINRKLVEVCKEDVKGIRPAQWIEITSDGLAIIADKETQ
jgi:hypothetical protein